MFNYVEVVFGIAENTAPGWKRRFFRQQITGRNLKYKVAIKSVSLSFLHKAVVQRAPVLRPVCLRKADPRACPAYHFDVSSGV